MRSKRSSGKSIAIQSPEQAQVLAAETEGWAIALQMVWQSVQSGPAPGLTRVGRLPDTLETLFDYLAQDVLARQPADIQRFLQATSVLRQMDQAACDHLLDIGNSADTLRQLHDGGLFVVSMGDGIYRYHRLFHDFLRATLKHNPVRRQQLHRQAAATSAGQAILKKRSTTYWKPGLRPGGRLVEGSAPAWWRWAL